MQQWGSQEHEASSGPVGLTALVASFPLSPHALMQFEKQFENLDVQSEFVEQAMNNQAVLSTPEEDVNLLMQQVADEHGLEVRLGMPQAANMPLTAPAQAAPAHADDLTQRLAELRR